MRKGFDGLQGLVTSTLAQDPLSGHLFLFVNRRRDKLKLLYWDGDGLAIWYRRLEQGTYQIPPVTPRPTAGSCFLALSFRTANLVDRSDLILCSPTCTCSPSAITSSLPELCSELA